MSYHVDKVKFREGWTTDGQMDKHSNENTPSAFKGKNANTPLCTLKYNQHEKD